MPSPVAPRGAAGKKRNVGMGRGRLLQRELNGLSGRIVDMDDAAMAVAALPRQVPAFVLTARTGIEGHAERGQLLDRARRMLDHELDRFAVVEAGPRNHRVLDVRFECVAFL